jgi:hypothetical protein
MAEAGPRTVPQLEEMLKRREAELMEYIYAEKVMIAAGKVSEATVRQAHELVQNIK